ncbi:aminoglycoside phosphotransferase family protein [Actinoplanes sp. CA-252034]|uniref:aminoglycoside phosphotransferase family protein n=1 Tax=Actinoplanes sp. CA-252034 TaxID=3239906 RepID=UPI003D95F99E
MDLTLPQSFLDSPRWWRGGGEWLAELPGLVRAQCERWRVTVDGDPAHGSNALVVPVRRDGEELVLRLAPPGPEVAEQAGALRFWDGRGTVRLVDADPDAGVMLLERLSATSLCDVPVDVAMRVLGTMMRRLAVPAPDHVLSTADAGIDRAHGGDWVVFRAVDYWLWGQGAGLTEDPRRCARLVSAFTDGPFQE